MPKRTSAAEKRAKQADATPVRFVIVNLDGHLAGTTERALPGLRKDLPGLELRLHAATEWADDPESLERCRADIAQADIILITMLVMEEHFKPILPALAARREACDALIVCMSASELMRLTRLGGFTMEGGQGGPMALLKRLRGNKEQKKQSAGAQQMSMLRRIPKLLRFIPGTAQDVRAYFLTLQYWLAGSDENLGNMIRFLVDRYADGERRHLRGTLKVAAPVEYPDVGLYHPRMKLRISAQLADLPTARGAAGRVGVLLMRSYVLAGNTAHYDGVIEALEARGLEVIPAFASGLDARPAIESFFMKDGKATVDAVISLTGFSLVGGPAYNDARAAEEMLRQLDVPYLSTLAVEFQTLDQWNDSEQGLLPVEATMMVAIPELDGATGSLVYGGRAGSGSEDGGRDMHSQRERAAMLAARAANLVRLRRSARAERKVAVVLFNFPPNAGNTGTAAYLSVFASLHHTLKEMQAAGYSVEAPETVDELRERIVNGNAARYGAHANVHTRIPADDHVRREPYLAEIEKTWGPAPGRQQSDGGGIFVLGAQFGNVFVGIQPSFGYEGDPMRLLFEKGFAPTHAFSAFYRYIREDFGAHAVLHFGTHGALEFMPGKQAGLSGACWPDRLIHDLPNVYLYASNNPSEGTIAKRRAAATLVSYLTPPIAHAGLYKGLVELKGSMERWRSLPPDERDERAQLAELIQAQAAELELAKPEPQWTSEEIDARIAHLNEEVLELEYTLIPHGLHVVGEAPNDEERIDMLLAVAESLHDVRPERAALEALVAGKSPEKALKAAKMAVSEDNVALLRELAEIDRQLMQDTETPAILQALDGRFIPPAPGGDLLRTPAILPTGRNLHGFDPFRLPSLFAVKDGKAQAQRLIDRHLAEGNGFPETIALVLWGTDNLKTEGGPIGQALALIGARPRFDNYGRLAGAELIPLDELGRPRIDVVMTLSGIFRDLLPLQTKLLADAAFQAAAADEPIEQNFIRKHALEYQQAHDCDLETAALRVFS
ncbi:MAG: magnesium chelatase subunit H, partial [Chromatiaceae bacterium]|nr:magnesium chelatase subunit H [Chromatiaceae bacterium]